VLPQDFIKRTTYCLQRPADYDRTSPSVYLLITPYHFLFQPEFKCHFDARFPDGIQISNYLKLPYGTTSHLSPMQITTLVRPDGFFRHLLTLCLKNNFQQNYLARLELD
jgi:hypothetical protein